MKPIKSVVFIMPAEREEAIEAYRDQLTAAEIEQIRTAPEQQVIKMWLYAKTPKETSPQA